MKVLLGAGELRVGRVTVLPENKHNGTCKEESCSMPQIGPQEGLHFNGVINTGIKISLIMEKPYSITVVQVLPIEEECRRHERGGVAYNVPLRTLKKRVPIDPA